MEHEEHREMETCGEQGSEGELGAELGGEKKSSSGSVFSLLEREDWARCLLRDKDNEIKFCSPIFHVQAGSVLSVMYTIYNIQ